MLNGLIGELPNILNGCHLEEDGLYHCDVCGEARQYIIPNGFLEGRKVHCICRCLVNERDKQERQAQISENERRRRRCFGAGWEQMSKWTFENDDKKNPIATKACIEYVKNFDEYYKDGVGIVMWGNVGGGKSYMSACIANALLDKGKSVLMSNFSELINRMQGNYEDRQMFIDSLNTYSLIIIDDLGIERNTEYMQEQVYNIVNTRYRAGKPIIVTTNLTINQLLDKSDIGKFRIYDRLLGKGFPLEINRESRRTEWTRAEHQQRMNI